MNTITLPDELAINSALSLKIYNYKTTEEISKQQVLLNKNTFSFLSCLLDSPFSKQIFLITVTLRKYTAHTTTHLLICIVKSFDSFETQEMHRPVG